MVLVVLIVIGMVLLVTCAALWPEPEERPAASERALTRRLLAGEIDQRHYRAELARLARLARGL